MKVPVRKGQRITCELTSVSLLDLVVHCSVFINYDARPPATLEE